MTTTYTRPRFNPADLQRLLEFPPFGGESLGYNTEGDVLVNTTADGVDVNALWAEVQTVLQAWNAERGAVASLLSRHTINAADAVPQSIADESFEEASEFGEPESLRAPSNAILLGNTLKDYDKAGRFTWKFLRDSTAEQIRAVTNYAVAADNKLVNGLIVNRMFNPAPQTNEFGHTCYGLWSADGMVPPPYLGKTFDDTHTHYLVSEADDIDSGDLEALLNHVTEHGYGLDPGSRLIAFMNHWTQLTLTRRGTPTRHIAVCVPFPATSPVIRFKIRSGHAASVWAPATVALRQLCRSKRPAHTLRR